MSEEITEDVHMDHIDPALKPVVKLLEKILEVLKNG